MNDKTPRADAPSQRQSQGQSQGPDGSTGAPTATASRRAIIGVLAGGAISVAGCAVGGAGEAPLEQVEVEYRLGPGDQLRVIVFGETDLTGQFVVGSQGSISYPLVGEVQAAGLTLAEFSVQLQEELSVYIRNPNVSVEVANYRPFFILGEVQRPGTYPYSANLTVHNAVATAGGFTYRANRRRVFIKHASDIEEQEYVLTSSTPVLPGDTVRVAERRF
jgi:polysaccharide export outer membrane protein